MRAEALRGIIQSPELNGSENVSRIRLRKRWQLSWILGRRGGNKESVVQGDCTG